MIFDNSVFLFLTLSAMAIAHQNDSRAHFQTLVAGESILVDTQSILCFESSVTVEVRVVGSGAACCCAGEGEFRNLFSIFNICELRFGFPK